jgi:hypothetical protein
MYVRRTASQVGVIQAESHEDHSRSVGQHVTLQARQALENGVAWDTSVDHSPGDARGTREQIGLQPGRP